MLSSVPLAVSGATFQPRPRPPLVYDATDNLANAVRSCVNGTATLLPIAARVAFLVPTFTLTPYDHYASSFYAFFGRYEHMLPQVKITTDLTLLTTKVSPRTDLYLWNHEAPFYNFLTSKTAARCGLVMGENLRLVTDIAADEGALFVNGVRQYDVLIVGHEEYVTRAEYNQLKLFVYSGGRIVEMSGNTFWAQVTYNKTTGMETFVGGHGYQFNGAYAWRSNYEPFDNESAGWFGSTYAGGEGLVGGAVPHDLSRLGHGLKGYAEGGHVFTRYSYPSNEVNYVRNFTNTELVTTFYSSLILRNGVLKESPTTFPVHSYVHSYGKGQVVCFCIFGENLIGHDRGTQFFLVYAVLNGFDHTVHHPIPPRPHR
jgi:hypothetical protein